MCGLAGLLTSDGSRGVDLDRAIRRMVAPLEHRGTDDDGVWVDPGLRGPLRAWAEDHLSANQLERDGILHAAPIRAACTALLAGHGDFAQPLWGVLLFQPWRQRWLS